MEKGVRLNEGLRAEGCEVVSHLSAGRDRTLGGEFPTHGWVGRG
jgi:hypothetical protein